MKKKGNSRVHFSAKSRNTNGCKNIDDVWWVSGMSERRVELLRVEHQLEGLEEAISNCDANIAELNVAIAYKQERVDFIDFCLKCGVPFAALSFVVSVLACDFATGISIWGGISAFQVGVSTVAKIAREKIKVDIRQLEDDRDFEELDRSNYNLQVGALINKRNVLKGSNINNRRGRNSDVEWCMPIYFRYQTDIDPFYSPDDEVFLVGDQNPYNQTANQLVKRIARVENPDTGVIHK